MFFAASCPIRKKWMHRISPIDITKAKVPTAIRPASSSILRGAKKMTKQYKRALAQRFRARYKTIRKDEDGAAALEFAMIAGPFFFLIFALMEVCMLFIMSTVLEHGVSEASRQIRTGAAQENGIGQVAFRNSVCAELFDLLDCDSKLHIDVQALGAGFGGANMDLPLDADGNMEPGGLGYNPGGPERSGCSTRVLRVEPGDPSHVCSPEEYERQQAPASSQLRVPQRTIRGLIMTIKTVLKRLNPRLKWRGIKGIRYNEDGVSAVEFALIAPLMVLLFLGCIELSFMMRADRRVTTTSASLGDLTARLATVSDADMGQMFAASSILMQPLEIDDTRLRITSIVDTGNGIPAVDWSDASDNWSPRAPGSSVAIPAGIVPSPGIGHPGGSRI
jgi:Flp pilus assembly protein TadG